MSRRFSTVVALCAVCGLVEAREICDLTYDTLLPFVPAAGWPNGWQGFVKIDNSFGPSKTVSFTASDDMGNSYPLSIDVGARSSLYFNSEDLERGNSDKGGLQGTLIDPEKGHWRLCFSDAKVNSYIRTREGFLTDMSSDLRPQRGLPAFPNPDIPDFGVSSDYPRVRVPLFNPASNRNQISYLRIINNSDDDKALGIFGIRSDGTYQDASGNPLSVEGFVRDGEAVENYCTST